MRRSNGVVLALALAACAAPAERFEFREPHMGTEFRIVLYAGSATQAHDAARAAFARVAELDGKLSDYDASSAASRLGAQSDGAVPTAALAVDDDLWRVLARGLELARDSQGAFDPTVGPVTLLWRRARRQGELPSSDSIAGALGSIGWQRLELDPVSKSVRLLAPRMRFDFGGIAKGFALDEALRELRRHGVERALVVGGGEMVAGSAPPDRPGWRIELAPFAGPDRVDALELVDAAVATSGDAAQALELDGVRHSHIVDPRTGAALTRRTAATVIARDGMTADGLATALCVLGPSDGLELIAATPEAHARVSVIDGSHVESSQSPGFARFILPLPRTDTVPSESSNP